MTVIGEETRRLNMARGEPFIIDHDDALQRARFLSRAGNLRGKWVWTAKEYVPVRSLSANRFWWGVVIPAFQRYMRDHGQFFEKEEIHEFFLQKLAAKTLIDPVTGEVTTIGRRSSKMDKIDFAQLSNDAIGWMHDRHGIDMPQQADFAPARKRTAAHAAAGE